MCECSFYSGSYTHKNCLICEWTTSSHQCSMTPHSERIYIVKSYLIAQVSLSNYKPDSFLFDSCYFYITVIWSVGPRIRKLDFDIFITTLLCDKHFDSSYHCQLIFDMEYLSLLARPLNGPKCQYLRLRNMLLFNYIVIIARIYLIHNKNYFMHLLT